MFSESLHLPATRAAGAAALAVLARVLARVLTRVLAVLTRILTRVLAAATSNLAALARRTAAALVLAAADNADHATQDVIRTRKHTLLEAVDTAYTVVLHSLDNVLNIPEGACRDVHCHVQDFVGESIDRLQSRARDASYTCKKTVRTATSAAILASILTAICALYHFYLYF